nr:hypothetical protein [Asgard group archaeon]
MKQKNLKLSGIMFAGVIVIVSFVYVIDTQPAVIGNPHAEIFSEESWVHTNQLMSFSSYEEFTEFLGNYSYQWNPGYYYEKGVS